MINRRQFLKRAAVGYGSLLLFSGCTRGSRQALYQRLSQAEADCLGAICEQFIPTDEYMGARDAGVVHYIDQLLYLRFPELQPLYEQGIQSLEHFCQEVHGNVFARLTWEVQYGILTQMEQGELPEAYWTTVSQTEFFFTVLRNTMQGYYGSPRHGGNKDYVSYRMMRLDYPQLIGQNRYE